MSSAWFVFCISLWNPQLVKAVKSQLRGSSGAQGLIQADMQESDASPGRAALQNYASRQDDAQQNGPGASMQKSIVSMQAAASQRNAADPDASTQSPGGSMVGATLQHLNGAQVQDDVQLNENPFMQLQFKYRLNPKHDNYSIYATRYQTTTDFTFSKSDWIRKIGNFLEIAERQYRAAGIVLNISAEQYFSEYVREEPPVLIEEVVNFEYIKLHF